MRRVARPVFELVLRLALLLATLAGAASPASAHNIPNDLTVKAYVKPEGQTLRLLIRVPLKGISDVEYPRIGNSENVDLSQVDRSLRDAAMGWVAANVQVYEGDRELATPRIASTRISLESDPSFASYQSALAHVNGPPLPANLTLYWEQGLLDVLFEYPITSDRSKFSIHVGLERLALSVVTGVQFMPPGGVARAYELDGDQGLVRLDPSWSQAAGRFVIMGFKHILSGTDHLLFLVCLVIPFRRIGPLIPIVTAFTVAHSITLISSAYGFAPAVLWFEPLIETLIAMSIFYMALENIFVEQPKSRWIITFLFGLVHGFGFSFILRQTLQFSGSHVLLSLLSFNIGVELGQLLVLILIAPLLNLLLTAVRSQRLGAIVLSAIAAHIGWHWMAERYEVLQQFRAFQFTTNQILVVMAIAAGLAFIATRVWPRPANQPS